MKIKDVEKQVGISKANIRFYEEEGLIHPARNQENNYREYSEADVEQLQEIKKQISELMKERRKLYRNGSEDSRKVRLSEINEELKKLRKEVRMTVRIEKHSLEIEERLRKAEEQNQNEKRVEHKEKESQEVR